MSIENISKYISLILRHKPEVIGISLDEHGWANVEELIEGIAKDNEFNMEMLEEIVATDNKQRYSFNEEKTLIRANQGHSIPVDVELECVAPPEYLWHGTGEKYVASIDETGLIPKSRLYVHLSGDEETAVKVGKRHGKPVLYRVSSGKMRRDGFEFFRSANGVWLTKHVPVEYLEKEPGKERQESNMGFSTEQINNLITGNALAAEITPSRPGLRKFIVVKGFELNERGQWKQLSKVLNTDKCETVVFQIRLYEVPEEFLTNNWDVTEDVLTVDKTIDQLQGIPALEKELKEYLDDFSVFVPEWKCENPL